MDSTGTARFRLLSLLVLVVALCQASRAGVVGGQFNYDRLPKYQPAEALYADVGVITLDRDAYERGAVHFTSRATIPVGVVDKEDFLKKIAVEFQYCSEEYFEVLKTAERQGQPTSQAARSLFRTPNAPAVVSAFHDGRADDSIVYLASSQKGGHKASDAVRGHPELMAECATHGFKGKCAEFSAIEEFLKVDEGGLLKYKNLENFGGKAIMVATKHHSYTGSIEILPACTGGAAPRTRGCVHTLDAYGIKQLADEPGTVYRLQADRKTVLKCSEANESACKDPYRDEVPEGEVTQPTEGKEGAKESENVWKKEWEHFKDDSSSTQEQMEVERLMGKEATMDNEREGNRPMEMEAKSSKSTDDHALESMAEWQAESYFRSTMEQRGYEKVLKDMGPIYDKLRVGFDRGSIPRITRIKSMAGKISLLAPEMAIIGLPFYALNIKNTFTNPNSTGWDKAAAVTDIVPFLGCFVHMVADIKHEQEKQAEPIKTMKVAAGTALCILDNFLPISMIYDMGKSLPSLVGSESKCQQGAGGFEANRDIAWDVETGDIVARIRSDAVFNDVNRIFQSHQVSTIFRACQRAGDLQASLHLTQAMGNETSLTKSDVEMTLAEQVDRETEENKELVKKAVLARILNSTLSASLDFNAKFIGQYKAECDGMRLSDIFMFGFDISGHVAARQRFIDWLELQKPLPPDLQQNRIEGAVNEVIMRLP
ncbi:hypothetical protein RJ55_02353 [Drechmeria coniospora]|nr:hypothetical protein RJ55_02353 [Drechmeria coniospora]